MVFGKSLRPLLKPVEARRNRAWASAGLTRPVLYTHNRNTEPYTPNGNMEPHDYVCASVDSSKMFRSLYEKFVTETCVCYMCWLCHFGIQTMFDASGSDLVKRIIGTIFTILSTVLVAI